MNWILAFASIDNKTFNFKLDIKFVMPAKAGIQKNGAIRLFTKPSELKALVFRSPSYRPIAGGQDFSLADPFENAVFD